MSPELIDPQRFGFEKGRPTKSSDCYALGMVIYETISGNLPFHEHTDPTVVMKVLKGERPPRGKKFTRSLWKMLELCWASQPGNRPSIEGVLRDLEMFSNSPEPLSPGVDEETERGGDDLDSADGSPGPYERTENDADDWGSVSGPLRVGEETETEVDQDDVDVDTGSAVHSARQSSPITPPFPPKRYGGEDYDEGVAEVLMDLASDRSSTPKTPPPLPPPFQGSSGRLSPRPMNHPYGPTPSGGFNRDSPELSTGLNQKRPLSPTSEDNGGEMKRPKVDGPKLSPTSKQTLNQSKGAAGSATAESQYLRALLRINSIPVYRLLNPSFPLDSPSWSCIVSHHFGITDLPLFTPCHFYV